MRKSDMDEVKNLMTLLEAEIKDFQQLIKDMAQVDSTYKNEFHHMSLLLNSARFQQGLEEKVNFLIQELDAFGRIYAKLVEDDEASALYIEAGLLDRSLELQKRIMSKLS